MKPKAFSYIRFSSPEQLHGDSLRRQMEASEKYAKENNLELDTTLDLQDLGRSGFTSRHVKDGALGRFLEKVKSGEIPEGSILIVEHFDRLSRDEILTAFEQFTSLINAGIKLVTLQDKMEYTKESVQKNWTQLIMSIVYMAKAYQESKDKSDRLIEAWNEKRRKGGEKILTKICPAWLELSKDEKSEEPFDIIPEAAEIIRLIYQMRLNGRGSYAIEKELNKMGGSEWLKSKRNPDGIWRKSYINKILHNPAVYGSYQPHKFVWEYSEVKRKEVRKRKPVGDPLEKYYPAVVSKDVFYRAKELFDRNREMGKARGGGRTGKISNLFTHIIKCSDCGSSMQYDNKGDYQYLKCKKSMKGFCDSPSIRYDHFESIILWYIKDLDVRDIIPSSEGRSLLIAEKSAEFQSLTGEISALQSSLNTLTERMGDPDLNSEAVKQVKKSLNQKSNEVKDLEKRKDTLESEIQGLKDIEDNSEKRLKGITDLIQKISDPDETDRILLRTKLRNQLQRLVERIDIKSGEFSHNSKPYSSYHINFRSGSTRRITLKNSEIFSIEDTESGHSVSYRLQNGRVTDVDSDDPKQEEMQRRADKMVAKRLK